jgi:hypothetical protein
VSIPALELDDEDDLRMAELDAIEDIRAHGAIGSSYSLGAYQPRSAWRSRIDIARAKTRAMAQRRSQAAAVYRAQRAGEEGKRTLVRVFEVVAPPPELPGFAPATCPRTREARNKIREIFLQKCMDLPYDMSRPERLLQLQNHFNVLIQDFNAKNDTNVPLLPGL